MSAGEHDVVARSVLASITETEATDRGIVVLSCVLTQAAEARSDRRLQYSMVCEVQAGHIKVVATA